MSVLALPEGRQGQLMAVGLTFIALTLLWLGVLSPALGWYGGRQAQLTAARQEAAHMAVLRLTLPALRAAVASPAANAIATQLLLSGNSDDIAGANLQSTLQNLATQTGNSLDSAAMIPPQPVGALRRIGVDVSVTATWPALIALLTAIETAQPRMIVDDLSVTASAQPDPTQDVPLQASFSVSAFRAGGGQ
jgi:general secretion pathway protein M